MQKSISKMLIMATIGLFSTTQKSFAQTDLKQETVLITGAANGIGKSTALLFASKGYIVYATDKDTVKLNELKSSGCKTLFLDVTDEGSIQNVVSTIESETKGVDILVNNAGYGVYGALEEVTIDAYKQQFDVNVWGIIRVTKAVLPSMRARKKGRIINISSVAGVVTTPYATAYTASKYAVESISDGLRVELKPWNIKVVLVQPSGVQTNFINTVNNNYPAAIEGNPYSEMTAKFKAMTTRLLSAGGQGILQPKDIADAIYKASNKKNPKTRYMVGFVGKSMVFMKKVLGHKGLDKVMYNQINNVVIK